MNKAQLIDLRYELSRLGVYGFLVPRADEHLGEYVPAAAERLAFGVKEKFGVTISVDVLDPGGLERSQGKAQRIIDMRGDHT